MNTLWKAAILYLVLLNSSLAAEIEIREIGTDNARFVTLLVRDNVTVIPESLVLQAGQQPGISIIVQKGQSLGGPIPYYANITINYSYNTDPDALKSALHLEKLDTKKFSVVQTVKYVTKIGTWDGTTSKYILRNLDAGVATYSSNLVVTFEVEFKDVNELAAFFQNSRPLVLITESEPEVLLTVEKSFDEVERAIESVIRTTKTSLVLTVSKIYLGLVEKYGASLNASESDIVSAITRKVATMTVQLDEKGEPILIWPENEAEQKFTSSQNTRNFNVQDRIVSTLSIDVCADPNQVFLIDISKNGCDGIKDLMELDQ
jgi:hypothetical protein